MNATVRQSRDGLCSVDGCEIPIGYGGQGLCQNHYRSMRFYGDLDHVRVPVEGCKIDGCDRRHFARGWCSRHYYRWQSMGRGDADPADWEHPLKGKGTKISKDGYRRIQVNGQRRMEHRVVMEEILGRPLLPTENVHHVNGQRADNRRENLELWTSSQPPRQRVRDLVAWAHQVIDEYGEYAADEEVRVAPS